ncbi:ATP-binding protein [Idiomarina sp. Sol25]|uniref:AAA family ATPase n=1 Tax=Idiomarina sp. Sol25 TaxID=3064000 RepID=UPI00294B66C4|nr:ATP-binding protein [Idiomarina sp. Sol25]MDV6326853.1 ATP-binding protein [Idiomarina sp. Sol25]
MLIEMSVANFRSLRDQQTFSLMKSSSDELECTNTFSTRAFKTFELLRSAAIYGPNASGKSNFLAALRTMKKIVQESASHYKRGDKLPVTPFRLNAENRGLPSEFEVSCIVDGVRYQYGFSVTAEKVHEEWLFAYPKGRPQRWFIRSWNNEEEKYEWDLGHNLTGEKQLWLKSTRDNALFLSTAIQLNSEQLKPLFDWFDESLRFANVSGWNPAFTASLCEVEDKSRVMDFMKAADLNIDDILVETEAFDSKVLPDDMPEHIKDVISKDLEGKKIIDIKTVHKDSEGKDVVFDLEDESDGTQKLFSFAGPWLDALENGYVLFIDELHDNLHPQLVQFLVQLFHSSKTNPKNAQLVFTTHETSILNQNVFRRDQIWFCEKAKDLSSHLFSLLDFSPRKGRENIEQAYLSGRYGAIPFVRAI